MAANDDYIVHGDDGKLYRVSRKDMHAHPVQPGDEAAKHAPAMHEMAKKLKGTAPHPFACLFAFASKPPANAGSGKRD